MVETTLEEQQITLKTIQALGDFGADESLKDDDRVWITKKEAYLLWNFIYGLLHRIYGNDAGIQEKQ